MTKTVVGSIPDEVIFVYSEKEKTILGDVYPAFVVAAGNDKTMGTAEEWASHASYWVSGKKKVYKETSENKNFKLKLIDLVKRSEGGRAYKVIVNDKFYVDLREDVLLDIIFSEKIIGRGNYGELKGSFLFATVGSQMKLVRKNSDLYNQLVQSMQDKKTKPISKDELKPGHVYYARNGDQRVFIGRVMLPKTTIFFKPVQHTWGNYGFDIQETDTGKKIECLIWYHWYDSYTEENDLNYVKSRKDVSVWFTLTRSHSFINAGKRVMSDEGIKFLIDKYIEKNNRPKEEYIKKMNGQYHYSNNYANRTVSSLTTDLQEYYLSEALKNGQK